MGRRSHPTGWAERFEPHRTYYEERLAEVVGCEVIIECNTRHDVLMVALETNHPSLLNYVADLLSALWPGFLAPLGVALRIVGGDEWDAEAMALRRHQAQS